jgi:hypothetical protein
MKKIFILLLILYRTTAIFAQSDSLLLLNYEKLILERAELQRTVQSLQERLTGLSEAYKKDTVELQKTITKLDKELSKLKKFKEQKGEIETRLQQKSDSIELLKFETYNREQQIVEEQKKGEQKAQVEYEKGKQSVIADIINGYKRPYEDLLKSSTLLSIQRDLPVIGNNDELKSVASDLLHYFNAKELLEQKFDAVKAQTAQTLLDSIRQTSSLLGRLKTQIENYQLVNDGFKEVIVKIIELDKREIVSGMSEDIQKQKFNKILSELSSYIFDYDFRFNEYPYLSDVLFEFLKRKQANADTDISDLLQKVTP